MEELSCKSVRMHLWDYAAAGARGDYAAAGARGDYAAAGARGDYAAAGARGDCPAGARGDYAARSLAQQENAAIDAHLDGCRDCDRCLADVSSLRAGFRNLPVHTMAPLLTTKLQVIASRERSRQLLRLDPKAWLKDKIASAMLAFDHFLRPFLVPGTGGILASCFCFSLIAHTLQLRPYLAGDDDMPIGIFTEMTIDDVSPFSFPGKDVTLEVTVDANGSVSDYSMLQGARPTPGSQEFEAIGSLLLYSTFTPAMRAGQPVASKRLFAIRHFTVRD